MKKLMTGLVMLAIGALGFFMSLNFASNLCVYMGVHMAAKCLIATAVFLVITVSGGLLAKKELFAENTAA
ncbi:MAG: hypothetical protein IJZ07_09070 [Clostridia bacterium]|nr:hypothetical protein [Clostridia bacterium]